MDYIEKIGLKFERGKTTAEDRAYEAKTLAEDRAYEAKTLEEDRVYKTKTLEEDHAYHEKLWPEQQKVPTRPSGTPPKPFELQPSDINEIREFLAQKYSVRIKPGKMMPFETKTPMNIFTNLPPEQQNLWMREEKELTQRVVSGGGIQALYGVQKPTIINGLPIGSVFVKTDETGTQIFKAPDGKFYKWIPE